jgi:hypothetical protein
MLVLTVTLASDQKLQSHGRSRSFSITFLVATKDIRGCAVHLGRHDMTAYPVHVAHLQFPQSRAQDFLAISQGRHGATAGRRSGWSSPCRNGRSQARLLLMQITILNGVLSLNDRKASEIMTDIKVTIRLWRRHYPNTDPFLLDRIRSLSLRIRCLITTPSTVYF